MATQRLCSIPECGKPHHGKGLCSRHYNLQKWKSDDERKCSILGCSGKFIAKGLCNKHYMLLRTTGAPYSPLHALMDSQAAFVANAASAQTDSCIIWPWGKNSNGYPAGPRRIPAHRLVCTIAHGQAFPGAHACHSCDTPACINQKHLRWGTTRENQQDSVKRNRSARGERSANAKLTEAQVKQIRAVEGSNSSIAKRFGVSIQTVQGIRHHRKWKHVA